jgi:hypothetical protein
MFEERPGQMCEMDSSCLQATQASIICRHRGLCLAELMKGDFVREVRYDVRRSLTPKWRTSMRSALIKYSLNSRGDSVPLANSLQNLHVAAIMRATREYLCHPKMIATATTCKGLDPSSLQQKHLDYGTQPARYPETADSHRTRSPLRPTESASFLQHPPELSSW